MTTRDNILSVQVVHGDRILYEGEATSVSSRNDKGRFDILPQHANYIALIKDFVSIAKTQGKEQQIVMKTGILRAYENKVQIFLGFDS